MAKKVVRRKVAKPATSPKKSAASTKSSAKKPPTKASVKKPPATKSAGKATAKSTAKAAVKPAPAKTGAAKTAPSKTAPAKTSGAANGARPTTPTVAKQTTTQPAAAKPPVAATKPVATAPARPVSEKTAERLESRDKPLGRPLVTADEKLYMVFKDDYHARQVFEFLRVDTLGELERFSPQEIISLLSAPVKRTVERIRDKLATMKRSLRDDIEFAKDRQPRPAPK